MPTVGDLFTLDTDASDRSIGAVLSQCQGSAERVIAYASKKLSRTEQNYSVTRGELLAIIHYLKYFRHYLLNVRFRVRTDHAALLWLRRVPEPMGQQARWLEVMEEFTFYVEHRPGRSHSNADAMSRAPSGKGRSVVGNACTESASDGSGDEGDSMDEKNVVVVREISASA